MKASMQNELDVFVCHAGEQKQDFVNDLFKHLTEVHGLRVFVDEHSLEVADDARAQVLRSLDAATVGMLLEFLTASTMLCERFCRPLT